VLVFDSYHAAPTWTNLQPILQQYAKLYPAMVQILNIGDYETLKANIPLHQMVLNLPESNPGYMPVTRDLSRAKRQSILAWLALGAPR